MLSTLFHRNMGRLKSKDVETESQMIILISELSFHKLYEVSERWKSSLSSDFKAVKRKTTLRFIIN